MASTPATTDKPGSGSKRFPLVHKLVQFADLRRHYADMREALKVSNRQAGAYTEQDNRRFLESVLTDAVAPVIDLSAEVQVA